MGLDQEYRDHAEITRLRGELASVRLTLDQVATEEADLLAAARQDAETIARLRETLQRIERESVDDVSRADAHAALASSK